MPKPTPKKEISVRHGKLDPRFLVITIHTKDAENWLNQHAPEFGQLHAPSYSPNVYNLWVKEGIYDPAEVAAWIESMGEK